MILVPFKTPWLKFHKEGNNYFPQREGVYVTHEFYSFKIYL